MMKKICLTLIASLLTGNLVTADCYKCEEIREKNKNLPPLEYEFYDDYLEALKAEGKPLPGNIDIEDENDEDSKDASSNEKSK